MKIMGVRGTLLLMACLAGVCGGMRIDSPNDGEAIPAKSRWPVTWQCDSGIQQVSIEFSFTNGVFWEPIVPAAACIKGRGSHSWTGPGVFLTDSEGTCGGDYR